MAEGAHGNDGIAKNPQIWTAAHTLDRVRGLGVASVVVGQKSGGQMSSGTASHDPDPVRIHTPFRGMSPDPPNGSGRILKHRRMSVSPAAKPVLDHKSMDALPVQEQGIIPTFVTRQTSVTTSGQNHQGGLSL
jgi:hypothetical protein